MLKVTPQPHKLRGFLSLNIIVSKGDSNAHGTAPARPGINCAGFSAVGLAAMVPEHGEHVGEVQVAL